MRAVGCSWLWAYCWFFWGLSGLHCSHSVRRKSIKVGLRCGPQWNLLQISASSHRSSQGWKCSGDSFWITISHCRKGAECRKFGYRWKQFILRRQLTVTTWNQAVLVLRIAHRLGMDFVQKWTVLHPGRNLADTTELVGWHHSEAEIQLQIGILIEQLSWWLEYRTRSRSGTSFSTGPAGSWRSCASSVHYSLVVGVMELH